MAQVGRIFRIIKIIKLSGLSGFKNILWIPNLENLDNNECNNEVPIPLRVTRYALRFLLLQMLVVIPSRDFKVFGSVNRETVILRHYNLHFHAVFQKPELFQFFDLLQIGRF